VLAAAQDVERFAEQHLRLLVPTLRRPNLRQRDPRRRPRGDVLRANRLTRSERILLGLVEPALRQEQLGEQSLAFAERPALLHRRKQPDGLTEELLGFRSIPGRPRELSQHSRRPRDLRRGGRFAVEVERFREPALGLLILSPHAVEATLRLRGARARNDAAALLRQSERAIDERFGLVLFHSRDVDPGELQSGPRFVILALGGARSLERLLLETFGFGEAADPSRDARTPVERPEAPFVVV